MTLKDFFSMQTFRRRFAQMNAGRSAFTCANLRLKVCIFGVFILMFPASVCAANRMSLDGMWRFMPDPTDSGEKNQYFKGTLPGYIRLPGIMQSQFGMDISTSTPWVLSLYDRYWYLRDDYKDYLQPGKVKVPFLSQPQR